MLKKEGSTAETLHRKWADGAVNTKVKTLFSGPRKESFGGRRASMSVGVENTAIPPKARARRRHSMVEAATWARHWFGALLSALNL